MKRTHPPTPNPDKEPRRQPQSGQRSGDVGTPASGVTQPSGTSPAPDTHPTPGTAPELKTSPKFDTSLTPKHAAEAAEFDALNELTRQRHAHACRIIPSAGTGSWIRRNYERITHELRYGAPPMLVVAALDGALDNPKDVRFGNAPVAWLAQTTTMSTKEASDLKSACTLLYHPKSIVLPDAADLSVGKRTVVQRQLQQELRQRLTAENIGTTALATIARASDNLSEGVKDQRLAIIYAALDSVTDRSASEFKRTIDTLVAEANRSPRANPKAKRQPKLTYQQPDGSGFALAYSYADATDQAQQRALTGDIATMIAQLATNSKLPNPLAGLNQAGRLWHAQHQSIKLTYSALRQGCVGFDSHGDLAILRPARRSVRNSARNSEQHLVRLPADGSAGNGNASAHTDTSTDTANTHPTNYDMRDDNDDCAIVPTPKASMVVYTSLEHYNRHVAGRIQKHPGAQGEHHALANSPHYTGDNDLSPHSRSVPATRSVETSSNPPTCFTNYGSELTAAQACELSPHGADHVAIVGTDGGGSIHTLSPNAHSGDVDIQQSLDTRTDTGTRSATRLQRIFLGLVQPYCAHPGCTIPAIECQAHHLHPYSEGGATTIENLALLCRFHHAKTDDSRRKSSQGHYAKDRRGVTYWQPHGDPLPQREYNEKNVAHYHQLNRVVDSRAPDEKVNQTPDQHSQIRDHHSQTGNPHVGRALNRSRSRTVADKPQDHPPP